MCVDEYLLVVENLARSAVLVDLVKDFSFVGIFLIISRGFLNEIRVEKVVQFRILQSSNKSKIES